MTGKKSDRYTFSPQKGTKGHCSVAQVWDLNGQSMVCVDSTEDENIASMRAEIITQALNEQIITGMSPSELADRVHNYELLLRGRPSREQSTEEAWIDWEIEVVKSLS